jgi:transposase
MLTEEEKIFIIKNYEHKTIGRIAQLLNRSRGTIYLFYKRWSETRTIMNRKKTGRKPMLSQRQIKRLETFINRNPLKCLREVKQKLNFNCHLRTLTKYIKKLGFRNFVYRHKPKIKQENKLARYNFTRKYSHWSLRQWKKVLFSDESSVELEKYIPGKSGESQGRH